MKKRLLALLISAALYLGMLPTVTLAAEEVRETGFFTEQTHTELNFEDLKYVPADEEAIRALMEETRSLMEDPKNMEAVGQNYDVMLDRLFQMVSMYRLLEVKTRQNVTDTELALEKERLVGNYSALADEASQLIRDILFSPCAAALDSRLTEEDIEYYKEYEDKTEEELAFSSEEVEQTNEYQLMAFQPITVEYEGKTWDEDSIYNAALAGEVDPITYYEVSNQLARLKNQTLGEYYIQMVEFHKSMAEFYGYDNYGDYAYENLYERDYTQAEIRSFHAAVKTYIVPVLALVEELYYNDLDDGTLSEDVVYADYTGDVALDMMEPYLKKMSSELVESFTYMREHGFYDTGYSETKSQGGFTTALDYWGAPFFYNCPNGNLYDFNTAVHEFGHYNDMFWQPMDMESESKNIDISEVHSQGMELLFSHWYPELFGEAAEGVEHFMLYQLLSSVVEGCLYGELEQYVYATDNVTLSQINREYRRLCGEYGMVEPGDPRAELYSWVDVPHLFVQPCYYISYAVSAAGAFSFWLEAQTEDYYTALDNYLTFTALPASSGFSESFEAVGLEKPYSYQYVKELGQALLRSLLGLDEMLDYEVMVQLNGEFLTFDDAKPQIRGDRTFLPLRAVLEAMGAELEWDEATYQVKATRGDTVVTLKIGENVMTVTQGETTDQVEMDVAPYIVPETGRTYVPVRFVAEALGCSVGWDELYRTAIIADTAAMLEQAMEGKEFTNLEKLAQFVKSQQDSRREGAWDTTGTLEGGMTLGGIFQVPVSGGLDATVADQTKLDMDLNIKADLTQLMALSAMGGSVPDAETQELFKALAKEGVTLSYRADLEAGKIYFTMAGGVLESAGMPENTWFSMDMKTLLAESGLDYAQLMAPGAALAEESAGWMETILTIIGETGLTSVVDCAMMADLMETVAAALSDEAFVTSGGLRTAALSFDTTTVLVKLKTEGNAVTEFGLAVESEEESETGLTEVVGAFTMDNKGAVRGQLVVTVEDALALDLSFQTKTVKGTQAPQTQPPAGAMVIDLTQTGEETPDAVDILNQLMGVMPLEED